MIDRLVNPKILDYARRDAERIYVGKTPRGPATSQAEIDRIHPHQFRHTFGHAWMAAHGNETDLMRLAGWRSRSMLSRGRYMPKSVDTLKENAEWLRARTES